MKEYLFFSKKDKITIVFLSLLIVILLITNVLIKNIIMLNSNNRMAVIEMNNEVEVPDVLQEKSLKGNNEEVNNLSENQISEKSNYQNNKQNENRNKEKLLNNRTTSSEVNQKQIVELNTADSSLLTTLNGIGPVFATRILKYKNLLGGYYSKNQLLDVYGFSQEKLGLIADFIFVDTTKIVKLDVNNLSFKQILKHPYFDYETTKTIVTEREKTPFTSLNDFIIRTKIESDSLLNYIKFF